MQDVTVMDPGFCTPRIVMQRWLGQGSELAEIDKRGPSSRCLHDYSDTSGLDGLFHGHRYLLR
jgi:hypothetical protein